MSERYPQPGGEEFMAARAKSPLDGLEDGAFFGREADRDVLEHETIGASVERSTAANIRAEMEYRHISNLQLASKLGWSPARMSRVLGGQQGMRVSDAAAIGSALGVSMEDLSSPKFRPGAKGIVFTGRNRLGPEENGFCGAVCRMCAEGGLAACGTEQGSPQKKPGTGRDGRAKNGTFQREATFSLILERGARWSFLADIGPACTRMGDVAGSVDALVAAAAGAFASDAHEADAYAGDRYTVATSDPAVYTYLAEQLGGIRTKGYFSLMLYDQGLHEIKEEHVLKTEQADGQ